MLLRLLCLCWALPYLHAEPSPYSASKADEKQGSVVEVEFEPMGMHGPSPEELLGMLSGSDGPRGMSFGPAPDLGNIFNSMLGGGQPPRRSSRHHRGAGHLGNGDAMLAEMLGDDNTWGPMTLNGGSSMPVTVFHDLFPEPFAMGSPEEVEVMNPPEAPDLMVADMLQHLNRMFKDDMLPAIHRVASSKKSRAACQDDVSSLCNGTKWQLHCLGQHADQISDGCRKRVGKSVPFLCHKAIGLWCDGLDRGILPCLADRLEQLDGSCRDAVVATHRVIAKVNTQRASMQDPLTGEKVVHLPTVPAAENPEQPTPTSSLPPVSQRAKREVQLDQMISSAPATKAPTRSEDRSKSTSTRKPAAVVIAEPHAAVAVETSPVVPAVPPASSPVLVAAAQAPPAVQGQGGHVSGLLQAAVMVALVGTCIYLLKSQVGVKSHKKGGALLELNTNTADHML